MNKKLLGELGLVTLITTLAMAFMPTINSNIIYALSRNGANYSCASIHFGMDDQTLEGDWSGSGTTWSPVVSGVTIREHESNERVYFSENNALKFNSGSKKDGEITLTLDYNIKQCTVYAAGWKDATPILSINDVSHEINGNETVTGTSGTVTYSPYIYALPVETNILHIAATVERVVIGDIALRTTSYVEPSKEYTISFDANGGEGTMVDVSVVEGAIYNLPDCGFTPPEGYTFDYWSLNGAKQESPIEIKENITLVANWKEKTSTETTITVSISDYASAHNWVNGTQYTTMNLDGNITATVSGGGNSGKYYTSGNQWRIYQTESGTLTIAAASGYTIKTITVTYASEKGGIFTEVASGTALTVNDSSITLHTGNSGSATNGQARMTAISVTYQ